MTTTHPSANDSGLNLDHLEALALEATPGRWMRLFGERTVYDRMEDGCRGNAIVRADLGYGLQDINNLDFIAAASPAALLELIALARRATLANQPAPTVPADALADTVLRDVCELDYSNVKWNAEDMLSVTTGDLKLIVSRNAAALAHQPAQEQAEAVLVTRESALKAIRHVAESSVPGKTIRAAHMLVSAPVAQQEPVAAPQQAAAPKPAHGHRDDYYLLANGRRLGLAPISRVRNMPNWVLAMELFATGSTSAHQLCRDAGVDPDSTTTQRATQLDGGQEGSESNG